MLIKKIKINLKIRPDIVITVTKEFDCYRNERWHVDISPQFDNYYSHPLFDINHAYKSSSEIDLFLEIFMKSPDVYIKLFEIQATIRCTAYSISILKKKTKEYEKITDFYTRIDNYIDHRENCDNINQYIQDINDLYMECKKLYERNEISLYQFLNGRLRDFRRWKSTRYVTRLFNMLGSMGINTLEDLYNSIHDQNSVWYTDNDDIFSVLTKDIENMVNDMYPVTKFLKKSFLEIEEIRNNLIVIESDSDDELVDEDDNVSEVNSVETVMYSDVENISDMSDIEDIFDDLSDGEDNLTQSMNDLSLG